MDKDMVGVANGGHPVHSRPTIILVAGMGMGTV